MHTGRMKLNTIAVSAAWLVLFACSANALATGSVQIGHFSVPAASQGWPYVAPTVAPTQIFTPNTTSDTTNPVDWLNPASVAGAGFNPSSLSPTSMYGSSIPYTSASSPYMGGYGGGYGGGYRSGIPFVGSGFSPLSRVPFLGGGFGIPFVGSIPYVGSIGSFGLPFLGRSFGGLGGGLGGGRGWSSIGSGFSPYNYGGFGGYGGYGGYGGFANPAAYMGGFGGGAHQGPVGNRVVQTGPSPSSGNYYQPATAEPGGASGGYYASGPTASAPPAAPPTKNQPKSYYDSYGTDNNWGGGGSPLPKDLNSVPWAK